MENGDKSDPNALRRIDFQVPMGVLADLHDAYPEARGEDWLAVTMAFGDGLYFRKNNSVRGNKGSE